MHPQDAARSKTAENIAHVIPHTYAIGLSIHCGGNGGIDHGFDLQPARRRDAVLFPASDHRRQDGPVKLSVVGSLGVLLAVCAVAPRLIH
jgi:hypothetical protein